MSPDGPIKCMQRQKHPLYCTLGFKRANENRGSRSREASFRDTTHAGAIEQKQLQIRWPWAVKFLFPGLKTHYFSEHCNWSVELYAYMHMKLLEVRLCYTILDMYNRIIFVLIKRQFNLSQRCAPTRMQISRIHCICLVSA